MMASFDYNLPGGSQTPPSQPPADAQPEVGMTPPQVLAQDAADGRRGAAWRLLHWLTSNDPRAIAAVESMQDDRLAHHLLEFLALGTWAGKPFVAPKDTNTTLAHTRLRTLFLAGSDSIRTEQLLVSSLHDKRAPMRAEAVHILGIMGNASTTSTLIAALHDHSPAVRVQAAKALGRIGDPSAVPALVQALHDADEAMSSQIFSALEHLGSKAVPVLLEEAKSSSPWIRWNSFRALSAIGDYRALPLLVAALGDDDRSVAWMSAKGLVHFGRMCIAPTLRLLMSTNTSPWLVQTSAYLLHELYKRDVKLKPYLEPVVQSMHGVAYQIGTPLAAQDALTRLTQSGLLAIPS
jgi:HEAT repeat protein